MMNDTERLFSQCRQSTCIYIYGAGRNAEILYCYLVAHGFSPKGFIVSMRANNPQSLFGIPVVLADAHRQDKDELIVSSVIHKKPGYNDIVDNIIRVGFQNVFFFSEKLFKPIRLWYRSPGHNYSFQQGEYYVDLKVPVEQNHSIFVYEHDGEKYHWRVENYSLEAEFQDITQIFSEKTALEEFEEQYGAYNVLKSLEDIGDAKDASLRVYMTRSHVDRPAHMPELPDWVIPIQVGAALTDQTICEIRDNQGDNISDRNHLYSEATALYWMWKNAPKGDYIGLWHYRRHMTLTSDAPRILAANKVDVLVTAPTFEPKGLISIFGRLIPSSDIRILLQTVREVAPDYYPYAQQFFKSRFYPPCNIAIMRDEIFREYASYLFSVTVEIDNFYRRRGLVRNDRYMGFLVECLLGIFLMKHREQYRIAYTDMKFYEATV